MDCTKHERLERRSALRIVAAMMLIGSLSPLHGCELVVDFDRSRIADAGIEDAGMDTGTVMDAGPDDDAGTSDAGVDAAGDAGVDGAPDGAPSDAAVDGDVPDAATDGA